MIAFLLHGGLAGTIFLMSRSAAARPAQLPVVSVRIVQPEPPRQRRRSTAPAAQPTRAPRKATPVPEPEPENEPQDLDGQLIDFENSDPETQTMAIKDLIKRVGYPRR